MPETTSASSDLWASPHSGPESTRKKKKGKHKSKTHARKLIVVKAEEVPIYLPNTLVEVVPDMVLFSSIRCTAIVEDIPGGTVLRIMEQDPSDSSLCLTQFCGKVGYMRIIDDENQICIVPAQHRSIIIENAVMTPNVLQKFAIHQGTVMEVLQLLQLYDDEDIPNSQWIDNIPSRTRIVVLKIGASNRLLIRYVETIDVIGWINVFDEAGVPAVGYWLESDGQPEYSGSVLEVKVGARFFELEGDVSFLPVGTSLVVDEIGTGIRDGQLLVSIGSPPVTGWIDALTEDRDPVLCDPEQEKSMGTYARRWFEAIKLNGYRSMMELVGKKRSFLSRNADVPSVDVVDRRNRTGLMYACGWGNVEVVILLLDEKADVHTKDDSFRSAMHYACKRFDGANDRDQEVYKRICSLLLGIGALVDDLDANGVSPLIFACARGDYDVVKFLVDASAHINHATNSGVTGMQMASLQGHRAVCALLTKYGALDDDSSNSDSDPDASLVSEVSAPSAPSPTPRLKKKKKVKSKAKSKSKRGKAKKDKAQAELEQMKDE